MNLPVRSESSTPVPAPLLSTYTILMLSGFLFGLCISNTFDTEVKRSFVLAGATGLMCFLALGVVKRVQEQSQQRDAVLHAEERLERHAHFDQQRSSDRITITA